jgi:probable phosphoglycerate mutase
MVSETTFGLMRHAETEWNREKRIQGHQDTPLTREGSASADLWGRQLRGLGWNRVLCSDLGRAVGTAALINTRLKLDLAEDSGLREQHWGEWTGRNITQLKIQEADRLQVLESAGWEFTPPGGESRRQVLERSMKALRNAAEKWPGQRILVVCHEGVVKCLIYHLSGRQFLPDEGRLLTRRHLHLISENRGRFELGQVNFLELDQYNAPDLSVSE